MSAVVYCGQCGNANPASNKFCGKCGSVIVYSQEKQPNTLQLLEQSSFNPNACPKCKNIDQIQKLSTIVAAGIHTTSGVTTTSGQTNIEGNQKHYGQKTDYVGSSTISGKAHSSSSTSINITEQSNLAMKLISPSRPQKPTLEKYSFGCWYTSLMLIVGILAFLGGAGLLVSIAYKTSVGIFLPEEVITIFILTCGGAAAISSATLLRNYVKSNIIEPHQKQANEHFGAEIEIYKNDITVWEKAVAR